jgi:hypothetical protein
MYAAGPIKTFTRLDVRDSPPSQRNGRLLTLAEAVEFFNLILVVDHTYYKG